MAGLRLEITGKEAALATLSEVIGRADDKRGLFDAIGAALAVSTQQRFETETGPDDVPWRPSLRKQLVGGRTLTDTARLVQSITHEATDSSVAIGTNVVYGAIHQMGGTIRAKTSRGLRFRSPGNGGWTTKREVTMPARPFLGVSRADEGEIEATAADFLKLERDNAGR